MRHKTNRHADRVVVAEMSAKVLCAFIAYSILTIQSRAQVRVMCLSWSINIKFLLFPSMVKTKSTFHYGAAKMCCLPLPDCPQILEEGVDWTVVREKIILGVLVDFDSSFTLLLNWALKRGWETFVPFFHAAESGGFSLRMLAAQVETCIVTKITHLVPFLCVAPRAYHKLNRLQWRWGKIFLGIRDHVEVRQTLVRTHCGWQLSLGAKVASEVLVICYSFPYPCFAVISPVASDA